MRSVFSCSNFRCAFAIPSHNYEVVATFRQLAGVIACLSGGRECRKNKESKSAMHVHENAELICLNEPRRRDSLSKAIPAPAAESVAWHCRHRAQS